MPSNVISKNNNITIYVDDSGGVDYKKIQDAINNSNPGDIIYVYNGFYHDNLNINKELILIREDIKNTIIDGDKIFDTISINSNNVKILGFTI